MARLGRVVLLIVLSTGCAAALNDLTPKEAARVAPEWLARVEGCALRYRFKDTRARAHMLYRCETEIVMINVKTGEVTTHRRMRSAGD